MKPLVSAVILTHNRKQLVMRAINSVLSQTYPNMECIVVDDASADGTKELLSTRKDIQYIYIPKEESKGGNYARNMGIKASKGEYVAFLDDDDYWLPSKTAKQLNLMNKKKCDAVYCGMRPEFIMEDGSARYENWLPVEDRQGNLAEKILTQIIMVTSSMLVRKKIIDKLGGFDEMLCFWQEYELSIRLAQETDIYAVPECLFVYRIDTNDVHRLTNKYREWLKSVHYIHRKHIELYKKLPLVKKIEASRMWHYEAYHRAQKIGLRNEVIIHKVVCILLNRIRSVAYKMNIG